MTKSFVEIANKIIEERGGDAYKETWLRTWLSNPDNEDKMMQSLLIKELTAEATRRSKKPKVEMPKEIKL